MGDLSPPTSAAIGATSGAVAEDFPTLGTGHHGVAHDEANEQREKLAEIDAELGIPPDAPADSGAALEKDVDAHASELEAWRAEDEKADLVK